MAGTLHPPPVHYEPGNPYKYAVMKLYDQMGANHTGLDLAEDPEHPGSFLDPAIGGPVLRFIYDDQDPEHSNLANFDWEPDGEATANQAVRLRTALKAQLRGIRKIARNIHSWHEIGVYSSMGLDRRLERRGRLRGQRRRQRPRRGRALRPAAEPVQALPSPRAREQEHPSAGPARIRRSAGSRSRSATSSRATASSSVAARATSTPARSSVAS
jgi:hypothetical protein